MIEAFFRPVCGNPRAFVEDNLSFTPITSPVRPGPISLDMQPWMAAMLEEVLNPLRREMVIVMCTQTGKTTFMILATGLIMTFDPGPMIHAAPTDPLANRFALTRLIPFLRNNKVLSKWLPQERDEITKELINCKHMPIYVTGAGSPAKLASVPAAYIMCDEVAKWEHRNKHEAHPAQLLKERQKTLNRRLMVYASTPNEEDALFWKLWKGSDMRYWHVPCPACGIMQKLEFARDTLKWEHNEDGSNPPLDIVERSAYYECPHCHYHITEQERMTMLRQGEWRADNPNAPVDTLGYHLNAFYSPFVSLGEIAKEYLKSVAVGSSGLQNFYNSWLGIPWIAHSVRVSDKNVQQCAMAGFRRGHLPSGVKIYYLITCYDPGQDATHWATSAIGERGAQYVVDWGSIIGVTTNPEKNFYGISAHFTSLEYDGVRPMVGFVDSGWKTKDVYRECMRLPGRLYPTKGSQVREKGSLNKVPQDDYGGLPLYVYADLHAKNDLYAGSISQRDGFEFYIPDNHDASLVHGLSGQILQKKRNGWEWKAVPDDHLGDCCKLARVSWWVYQNLYEPLST